MLLTREDSNRWYYPLVYAPVVSDPTGEWTTHNVWDGSVSETKERLRR